MKHLDYIFKKMFRHEKDTSSSFDEDALWNDIVEELGPENSIVSSSSNYASWTVLLVLTACLASGLYYVSTSIEDSAMSNMEMNDSEIESANPDPVKNIESIEETLTISQEDEAREENQNSFIDEDLLRNDSYSERSTVKGDDVRKVYEGTNTPASTQSIKTAEPQRKSGVNEGQVSIARTETTTNEIGRKSEAGIVKIDNEENHEMTQPGQESAYTDDYTGGNSSFDKSMVAEPSDQTVSEADKMINSAIGQPDLSLENQKANNSDISSEDKVYEEVRNEIAYWNIESVILDDFPRSDLPFSMTKRALDTRTPIVELIDKKPRWTYQMGLFSGANITDPTFLGLDEEAVMLKNTTEKLGLGTHAGIDLAAVYDGRWSINTGLHTTLLHTIYKYDEQKTVTEDSHLIQGVELTQNNVLLAESSRNTSLMRNIYRASVHNNYYQTVSVPILFGWQTRMKSLDVGLYFGPQISYRIAQSGRTIDADNAYRAFTNDETVLLSKWNVELSTGAWIAIPLTKSIDLKAGYYLNGVQSKILGTSDLTARIYNHQLRMGLTWSL